MAEATCQCGKYVTLRKDGTFRKHSRTRTKSHWPTVVFEKVQCENSGKRPIQRGGRGVTHGG